MQIKTVREVLDYVSGFHSRAARLFEDAARHTHGTRERMLLHWLAQRETGLAEGMKRFEDDSEAVILGDWLQNAPDSDRIPLTLPSLHDEMSLDDALDLALRLDDSLAWLFRTLAESHNNTRVREFFRALLNEVSFAEAMTARSAASAAQL
jgi:hypothetical protein